MIYGMGRCRLEEEKVGHAVEITVEINGSSFTLNGHEAGRTEYIMQQREEAAALKKQRVRDAARERQRRRRTRVREALELQPLAPTYAYTETNPSGPTCSTAAVLRHAYGVDAATQTTHTVVHMYTQTIDVGSEERVKEHARARSQRYRVKKAAEAALLHADPTNLATSHHLP